MCKQCGHDDNRKPQWRPGNRRCGRGVPLGVQRANGECHSYRRARCSNEAKPRAGKPPELHAPPHAPKATGRAVLIDDSAVGAVIG